MDAEPVTPDAFLVLSAPGLLPLPMRPLGGFPVTEATAIPALSTYKPLRLEPPGRWRRTPGRYVIPGSRQLPDVQL